MIYNTILKPGALFYFVEQTMSQFQTTYIQATGTLTFTGTKTIKSVPIGMLSCCVMCTNDELMYFTLKHQHELHTVTHKALMMCKPHRLFVKCLI